MATPYQVPLHFCQWCYKNTGRFIIDCLCLVCQSCLNTKKNWVDEKSRCFNCNKNTARRFIDLKNNPQQGGFYFQNVNHSARNFLKIQQFQQEVAKKYCKHLQSKLKKLQKIIKQFVHQFPKYGSFFQSAFNQLQQKENKNGRSKSAQTQMPQINAGKMTIHHNNTQRNLSNVPSKHQNMQRTLYEMSENPKKNFEEQKKNYYPQKQEKREKTYKNESKTSYSSMESNLSGKFMYQHQNPQIKKKSYQNEQNYDSAAKSIIRKEPSKMMINPGKRDNIPHQGYPQNNINQIYVVGGSRKVSDPRRQQLPIKLNNAVNIQTAIRSIRSEDQKEHDSKQKSRKVANPQYNPQNDMFRYQQGPNLSESDVSQNGQNLHFFGRRPK